MSQDHIAEDIRLRIAQSIVIVEPHRNALSVRLQERLAALDTPEEAFGQGEVTAMMLTDLLFEEARGLSASGRVGRLGAVIREHRRLDIDAEHYARFGTALGPVLQEVLGPRLPPRIASAWVDGYWFIIHQLEAQAPALRAAFGRGPKMPALTRVGRWW